MIMQIDKIIKAAFERVVEENRSKATPFLNYSSGDLGEKSIIKNRRGCFVEISLFVCFIIIFSASVFFKDSIYRSPLANQGALIAQLIPKNPRAAFYEFILAIHSSF